MLNKNIIFICLQKLHSVENPRVPLSPTCPHNRFLSLETNASNLRWKKKGTIIWMTMESWEVVACGVNERSRILQEHYRIITHMAGLVAFTLSDNILRIKDVGAALCQGPGSLTHSNAKAQC